MTHGCNALLVTIEAITPDFALHVNLVMLADRLHEMPEDRTIRETLPARTRLASARYEEITQKFSDYNACKHRFRLELRR